MKIAEILKLWAEIGKDDVGIKRWGKQVDILKAKIQELDASAKKQKKSTKEVVDLVTYPLMTLGQKGRWGKDISKWIKDNIYGELVTQTPIPTTTPEEPSFQPPVGGMPTGNLIIILPPMQGGQYGSQLNLGAWSSLIERSGQDTVINAGTINKPTI